MDTTTFHDLYDAHADAVRRLARYLTGNDDAAKDIVSETFLRAWAGRGAIRAPTARAYLLTIARNLATDYHRASARHSGGAVPDTPVPPDAEAQLDLARVLAALGTLHADYRDPLTMAVAGSSHEEIGRALGLTPGTVKVRVHRARLMLAAAAGERTKEPR